MDAGADHSNKVHRTRRSGAKAEKRKAHTQRKRDGAGLDGGAAAAEAAKKDKAARKNPKVGNRARQKEKFFFTAIWRNLQHHD